MANITIWGASYSAVPAVTLPKTGGGTARFTDTSASTCSAVNMTYGTIGYDANGNPVTGSIIDGDLLSYGTEIKIPASYEQVECVVSHGSGAHLYTGVSGDDSSLELDFCYEFDTWASYKGYCGNYRNESSNCWRIIFPNTQIGTLYASLNTKASSPTRVDFGSTFDAIANKKVYVLARQSYIKVTIDGVAKEATISTSGSANTNALTFGRVKTETSDASASNGTSKWYFIKIKQGTNLIRWYIPCYRKSDNAVGFYDLVNKSFHTSAGLVEFSLT